MKNKYLSIFLALILCYCLSARADGFSLPSLPPSPDAAALGKYGQYPVSLHNGLVQIDIPIYTVELPLTKVPISLSYHASGIKVNDISTTVGLGWVLNAGGVITRSVKGAPDIRFGSTGTIFSKQWMIDNLGEDDRLSRLDNIYNQSLTGAYDSESDIYYYNVCGLSGNFRFDIDGNLVQIPLTNNIIEFDGTNFRIIGSDGTIYEFRDKEISLPNIGFRYTSSWYLSSIITTDNNFVSFEYLTDNTHYMDKYVNYVFDVRQDIPSTNSLTCNNHYIQTDNTLLIKSIEFPGGVIRFNYNGDRADRRKYRLKDIDIRNNNQRVKSFSLEHGYFTPTNVLTFDQVQPSGNYGLSTNYRLKMDKLILLDSERSYVGEYRFDYNKSVLLPAYLDFSSDIRSIETGVNQRFFGQDHWGYYNGITTNNNSFTYAPVQSYTINRPQANRSVNPVYAQACILKKITYPTGGYTEFNYEGNKYSSGENAGGLRIHSIISDSKMNSSPKIQSYQYEQARNNMTGGIKIQGSSYTQGRNAWGNEVLLYDYYTSEPDLPLSHTGGASVYYQSITEYNGYPQNSNGKTEYYFNYSLNDVEYFDQYPCILPRHPFSPHKFIPQFEYLYIDRGWTRGHLGYTKMFSKINGEFVLLKQTDYRYTTFKKQRNIVGFKSFPNFTPTTRYLPPPFHGQLFRTNELFQYTDIIAETGLVKLTEVIDSSFNDGKSITQSTVHFYDRLENQFEVTAIHQKKSDGSILKKNFTYPRDINLHIYQNMAEKNILSPVIITTDSIDNNFLKETQTSYSAWLNSFIAPSNIRERIGNGDSEIRIVYHKYDLRGNPLYVSKDNSKNIVYLWGYDYRYLIAQIENATYTQVVAAISGGAETIKTLASSASPDFSPVNALRNSLPDALITTYTYKPLVGILTKTEPNGIVTNYEYDTFGRLILIRNHEGGMIKSFEYQYINR